MIKLSRKFLVILMAIILGIYLPQLDAKESGDLQYNTYANTRFDYTIKYPLNILIPQGESANGDGQKFISPIGQAVLTIWGEHNALGESLKSRYNESLNKISGSITYKAQKDNWFVISGYQGDKIFYQKTIFNNDIIKTFTITYSKGHRQLFDPIVKEISSSFGSPLVRGQTESYGLPDGAKVVEIQPLRSEKYPRRALILWILNPQREPRSNPDEPYSCPELTRGHYYSGPTRVSLVNTQDQTIINTIEIKQEYNVGKDYFDIPYLIEKGHYYHVVGVKDGVEGKPIIMWLQDYNGDGKAFEFVMFDSLSCNSLKTSLIGYSEVQDKVIQYPFELSITEGQKTSNRFTHWVEWLFYYKSDKFNVWKYRLDYRGHDGPLDKYEIRYNQLEEKFTGNIKRTFQDYDAEP